MGRLPPRWHAAIPAQEIRLMSDQLVEENKRLRDQLAQLLQHAHQNQQIWQRHQAFDLQLIASPGVRDLLDRLFLTLAEISALEVITLTLLDEDYQIRRIMVELGIKQSDFPRLLFVQEWAELGAMCTHLHKPLLAPYREELHGALFPDPIPSPASVAFMPLSRNEKMIGCLNFGSADPSRFGAGMSSEFLSHMASIVAICVENVINNERLRHIGLTDALTGVHNRRHVEVRLIEEIERARRHRHALSFLYIDIDHFKRINDTAGHQAGDLVLRDVAALIKAELRLSDTLGRFGGEEFVVILTDANNEDAQSVAERIRWSIADQELRLGSDARIAVSVSIGVATLPELEPGATPHEVAHRLLGQADKALYRAKEDGRNRVVSAN
jgi:two-component system, cell cycle response regulator